jgi:hypothetical protein
MMVPFDGPRVTDELIHRLEGEEIAFTTGWLQGAMARPGNPRGLRIERFGDAVAPLAANAPELDFMNRVAGLAPENADVLPRILSLYRAAGIRPWFEVAPYSRPGDPVGVGLASSGAIPEWHSTLLYAPASIATMQPAVAGGPSSQVSVRRVEAGEISLFADVLLRGWGVPDDELAEAIEDHGHWPAVPGWRLYLAEVDGEPAAAAVLQVRGGVGYLATASTLPSARGRGCQTALIRRRIVDAAAEGCDLVSGQALLGSTSQQNMERAGLRPACTLTTWRLAPVPA